MLARKLRPRSALMTLLLSLVLVCGSTLGQHPSAASDDARIEARVDTLLKQMTLEEKVGQLVQRVACAGVTGLGAGGGLEAVAARGEVGSLFGASDPQVINKVQRSAMEKSRLHIPVLFGLDVIHGFRTDFPVPLAMASTWNPDLVERASRMAAEEASAGRGSLDLLAHGGYRARCPLGPHRGGRG